MEYETCQFQHPSHLPPPLQDYPQEMIAAENLDIGESRHIIPRIILFAHMHISFTYMLSNMEPPPVLENLEIRDIEVLTLDVIAVYNETNFTSLCAWLSSQVIEHEETYRVLPFSRPV